MYSLSSEEHSLSISSLGLPRLCCLGAFPALFVDTDGDGRRVVGVASHGICGSPRLEDQMRYAILLCGCCR